MRKKRKRQGSASSKSSIILDEFTHATLQQWRKKHRAAHDFQTLLYFDLEAQRAVHREELYDALRAAAIPFRFESWKRVVNYRYTLHPLSSVGNLKSIGGRFNFGEHIDPKSFKPFPALYIADTDEVARAEYFQAPKSKSALTAEEYMLMKPQSYSVVSLRGNLTRVFDLRRQSDLHAFVRITKHFTLSGRVKMTGKIADASYNVIKSEKEMYEALMLPNWRFQPSQYDVPSNPQIFGNMLCGAGLEGVIYRSVRSGGTCIAIFPQNFDNHDVYVEIVPPVPAELELSRLDWTTWRELVEE